MGYMMDTGNNDARTEGMSYGMMMAVQMDRKDIFDRLWLFSKTFMYQSSGKYEGYFAWSVATDGKKNAQGPAPDGEEYYAMALFFASKRWGDGEAPFDYSIQARDILFHGIHQAELGQGGSPMWEAENHYIKFVPEADFSDPSYHLPHFYELFAERANEEDREFWKAAAAESRKYLHKSCHSVTGMASEYAEYDGSPKRLFHDGQFYSDAYRVSMNIGLDAAWFYTDESLGNIIDKLQAFFSENTTYGNYHNYMLDGTALEQPALHPVAIIATNAAGSLAAKGQYRLDWVKEFYNTPLRKGDRRYYDNCLYFFCLLMLAGEYKIY
jgi:oligosaccharide reducing-end xylanase